MVRGTVLYGTATSASRMSLIPAVDEPLSTCKLPPKSANPSDDAQIRVA
jgi:hypothetical protein